MSKNTEILSVCALMFFLGAVLTAGAITAYYGPKIDACDTWVQHIVSELIKDD